MSSPVIEHIPSSTGRGRFGTHASVSSPSLPDTGSRAGLKSVEPGQSAYFDADRLDLRLFEATTFQADAFLVESLQEESESSARRLLTRLKSAEADALHQLQSSVFEKSEGFVSISKEIAHFEGDMLAIRMLLNDYKALSEGVMHAYKPNKSAANTSPPASLLSPTSTAPSSRHASAKSTTSTPITSPTVESPSSIDESAQQRADFLELGSTIDGIAPLQSNPKRGLLPVPPSQNISAEERADPLLCRTDRFYEMVAHTRDATLRQVQLYLLTDQLLVVKILRKKKSTGPVKLAVDKSFPLLELTCMDVKNLDECACGFKVQWKNDAFIYQCEDVATKKKWIKAIDAAVRQCYRALQPESKVTSPAPSPNTQASPTTPNGSSFAPSSRQASPSSMYSDDAASLTSVMASVAAAGPSAQPADLTPADARRFTSMIDALEVKASLCQYQEAVDLVQQAREFLVSVRHRHVNGSGGETAGLIVAQHDCPRLLQAQKQLDVQVQHLSGLICQELANPWISKRKMMKAVEWMAALGLLEMARQRFLSTRSFFIRQKTRHMKYYGEIELFIKDYTQIIVSIIKTSYDWYSVAFAHMLYKQSQATTSAPSASTAITKSTCMSGFLLWVHDELEAFAANFARQVFQPQFSLQTILACYEAAAGVLESLAADGINMLFVLDNVMQREMRRTIEAKQVAMQGRFDSLLTKNAFLTPGNLADPETVAKLGSSIPRGIELSEAVIEFCGQVKAFVGDLKYLAASKNFEGGLDHLVSLFDMFSQYSLRLTYQQAQLGDELQSLVLSDAKFVKDTFLPKLISDLKTIWRISGSEFDKCTHRLDAIYLALEKALAQKAEPQPELPSSQSTQAEHATPQEATSSRQ